MDRASHDMSHSPQSPGSASIATQSIKISNLLNDNMQSSSSRKVGMPPSGLPTPDSTPIQELIQESSGFSFQESPSSGAIDPTVLPSHISKEDTRAISLFPEDVTNRSNSNTSPRQLPQIHLGSRSLSSSPVSVSSSESRRSPPGRDGPRQARPLDLMDVAFQETVPAEVWYQLHASDKAGVQRPETIAFRSQVWTAASMAPKEYVDQIYEASYDLTFSSGKAAGLNWLSTVCEQETRLNLRSSKVRARATSKTEPLRRISKIENRHSSTRRPSLKKRVNTDGGEPEAKRMRAAAVHKEKPNSYLEVPNYSPPLNTFNAANVRAFVPKGGRIDLSSDPQLDLIGTELNQQEKNFAEVNQLDINKYLINKRKIFQGRIQIHLQGKKSFTKTHAQQAAIIDVNKASRMWEFFDQAGWLDIKHFKKFIAVEKESMLAKNMAIAKEFLD